MIHKLRKEAFEEGFQEGLEQSLERGSQQEGQGEIQYLQNRLVNIVRERYPDLAEYAQQQASRFSKSEVLNDLIIRLKRAPDPNKAKRILDAESEICAKKKKKEQWRMIEDLAKMPCEKCPVGTPKMTDKQIGKWRKHIPDWL